MLAREFPNDREISGEEWPGFASRFLRERIDGARKDFAICLTAAPRPGMKDKTHAYFPAFMVCMGLLEMLSGLYHGSFEPTDGLSTFQIVDEFRKDFLKPTARRSGVYDEPRLLGLMIAGFRHKVAHLAHPYLVFDMRRTGGRVRSLLEPHVRVSWQFNKGTPTDAALSLERVEGKHIQTHETPWPVPYDAKFQVSLMALLRDLSVACFDREHGYLAHLIESKDAMERFRRCMEQYCPRGADR